MTEKKFTSRDLLRQLHPTPDLAYEFNNEEVLEAAKFFLRYVGYTLDEKGRRKNEPVFYGKRSEGEVTYEIMGLVRHSMKEVADGVAQLVKMKGELGEKLEYVIALPPVQERHLIDYMTADDYKLYKDLRENGFAVWICNPQEKSVWCPQGTLKDKRFAEYYKVRFGGDLMGMLANMPYRGGKRDDRRRRMEGLMEG